MHLSIIAAYGRNKEMGYQGSLPWKLPSDLKHFKSLTQGHSVIMGRKTADSIGKPLPNRENILLTHDLDFSRPGYAIAHTFDHALQLVTPTETEAFIIGGASIYAIALTYATRMYLTEVDYAGVADVYFPNFSHEDWHISSRETPLPTQNDQHKFSFVVYDRNNPIQP